MSSESASQSIPAKAKLLAFFELTKPRIAFMVLLSIAAAAVVAAGGSPGIWPVVNVGLGMFLVAASGNAANMYIERYTDFLMPRTARRPLPDKRLTAGEVASFAAVTFGIGAGYLLATMPAGVLLVACGAWLLYVLVYTPLKVITPLNTEVGAIAGALPVLVGAMAPGVPLSVAAWSFFLVLVFWQFPHFMAIAWMYREDYRQGGIKMITVTEPTGRAAGRKAIILAILTTVVSIGPVFTFSTGMLPWIFGIVSVLLGAWYLSASIRFARQPDQQTARRLLRVSVYYLPLYMIGLVTLACLVK